MYKHARAVSPLHTGRMLPGCPTSRPPSCTGRGLFYVGPPPTEHRLVVDLASEQVAGVTRGKVMVGVEVALSLRSAFCFPLSGSSQWFWLQSAGLNSNTGSYGTFGAMFVEAKLRQGPQLRCASHDATWAHATCFLASFTLSWLYCNYGFRKGLPIGRLGSVSGFWVLILMASGFVASWFAS